MVKNEIFFRIFWPTLWKPLGQPGWLYARMCVGLFPTYATTLDDAQENRNGRRLIIPKTGITSLTFWTTLYDPVGDGSIHMQQMDKAFFRMLLICLYL